MNNFQEIINGNARDRDGGCISEKNSLNLKICQYQFNFFADGIRQSLRERWITISDYLKAGGVLNLSLPQDEEYNFSKFDSQIKTIQNLKNDIAVIISDGDNCFLSCLNSLKVANGESVNLEEKIAESFSKAQDAFEKDVDIFIAGGNYFSNNWLQNINNELIKDIQDREKRQNLLSCHVDFIVDNFKKKLSDYIALNIDTKKVYVESIDFLVKQVKKSFGDVDPLILGCNRISMPTDVVVNGKNIALVKPLQSLDSINQPFTASKIEEICKQWDDAEKSE